MPTIGFTVEPSAFIGLSPGRSVALFRQLLWAEAGRVGIGRHLINVPDCINVGDGGVDAYIDYVQPSDNDLIPQGASVYQVKSADLEPMKCRQELHIQGDLKKPLKHELSLRLQQGASYVLVLMASMSDEKLRRRLEALQGELDKLGYGDTPVRVYTASQLAGFANRHPAFVTSVRMELSICSPYEGWGASLDVKRPTVFVADDGRQALVDQITNTLRERTESWIIRLTGLPGVGKTRSCYEALRPDDLKHQVLYVRQATGFAQSALFNSLVNDSETSAILVVDECDLDQHRTLANAIAGQGPRLALITISYEVGQVPLPTNSLRAEQLERQTVEEILRQGYPEMSNSVTRRLAEFSDGYPHIAVLLADQHVAEGVSEEYLSISDDRLLNRLVGGTASSDSQQFRVTKRVLRGMSLFHRIGVTGSGETEGRWLAARVGVDWLDFQRVIYEQKERGIVQGEHYVFVTPFMLRVHLLKEWWQAHGFTDEDGLNVFVSSMPDAARSDLLRRFFEHFPYVATAPQGDEFVQQVLADGGFVSNYDVLNSDIGGRLFLALTEANPAAALRTAQRVLGSRSRDELLQFREGRRSTIEALMRMAVWVELFQPAAKLMLALAEAETEDWDNNATGEFASLFSVGLGPVAATQAPASERFPVLREAVLSPSPIRRKVGLKACESALKTAHFFRRIGAEYQGVKREPDLWAPTTYGELFDAYRSVWALTLDIVASSRDDGKAQAVNVLLSSARGLAHLEPLTEMVSGTIRSLASDPDIDQRDLIARVVEITHYDGPTLSTEARRTWEHLEEELCGDSFGSRLQRYVAMELVEDRDDSGGEEEDRVQPNIERLASEAIEAPGSLTAELHWLVTKRAEVGGRFGYELGKHDEGESFLAAIIGAQAIAGDTSDLSLLGGYCRAMSERDTARWEDLMDGLASNPSQAAWVVELTWRSTCLTKGASDRVLTLIRTGKVSPAKLRVFRYGQAVESLGLDDFIAWVDTLLDSDDSGAVPTALDLLVRYGRSRLPSHVIQRVVCHPHWFNAGHGGGGPYHDTYWWSDMAVGLCNENPEAAFDVAKLLLMHLGKEGTVAGGLDHQPYRVLNAAMQKDPERVWQYASSLLGPPIDGRAFLIGHWLRGARPFGPGGSAILELVPHGLIWEWVDEHPESRAVYLASFVPRIIRSSDGGTSLARELLLRHGQDPEVRSALRSNFSTEGWSGSTSQHLEDKRSWLQDLRVGETDPNALTWIDEYDAQLLAQVRVAREEEERQGH